MREVLAALSHELVRRLRGGESLTHGGDRDVYQALGYPNRILPGDFVGRYKRGGIASRLVDLLPKHSWSDSIIVQEDDDPEISTPFEEEISDLFELHKVWTSLTKLDILSRITGWSGLLFGASGSLSSELSGRRAGDLAFIRPLLGEVELKITKTDDNPNSERFGQPTMYSLVTGKSSAVHWTRIQHVVNDSTLDDIRGASALEQTWNHLLELEKMIGAGAEATWLRAQPGMQIDVNPEIEFDEKGDEAEDLRDQVDNYIHGMSRLLRTRGATVKLLSSNVPNVASNVTTVLDQISAISRVPKRVLFGSERGELASSQDRTAWGSEIFNHRQLVVTPTIRTFIDTLTEFGFMQAPDEYSVVYPEMSEIPPGESAEIVRRLANANKLQKESGQPIIISSDEIREKVLELEPLDTDDTSDDNDTSSDTSDNSTSLRALQDGPLEWRIVDRIVNDNFSSMAEEIYDAWTSTSTSMEFTVTESGFVEDVLQAVDSTLSSLVESLTTHIQNTLFDAANALSLVVESEDSWFVSSLSLKSLDTLSRLTLPTSLQSVGVTFDSSNESAVKWAEKRAADLIVEMTPDTREAVRAIISHGIESGVDVVRMSNEIRQSVGLRIDQVEAWIRAKERLTLGEPGTLVDVGGVGVRIPKSGSTATFRDKHLRRYAARLLRQRSILIARTETARAANEGIRQLWLQAISEEQLKPTQKRVWIATLDDQVRDAHADMDGQVRPIGVGFTSPEGSIIEPGEEPNCRCSQGLIRG